MSLRLPLWPCTRVLTQCSPLSHSFILDDPTAAVDAWVGQHLFNKCVAGALAGKTRLFVTNHVEQAERADLVVVMEGGRVAAQGSYEDVAARCAAFQELLNAYVRDGCTPSMHLVRVLSPGWLWSCQPRRRRG